MSRIMHSYHVFAINTEVNKLVEFDIITPSFKDAVEISCRFEEATHISLLNVVKGKQMPRQTPITLSELVIKEIGNIDNEIVINSTVNGSSFESVLRM